MARDERLGRLLARAAVSGAMLGGCGASAQEEAQTPEWDPEVIIAPDPEMKAAPTPVSDVGAPKPPKGRPKHTTMGRALDADCCRGRNSCAGKGNCAVEGKHDCKGRNACKGQGGCECK